MKAQMSAVGRTGTSGEVEEEKKFVGGLFFFISSFIFKKGGDMKR
jgi:hypothetical protein